MSFIRNRSNDEWRKAPGMVAYIECTDTGEVLVADGQEHEELPIITNSFIELGGMIGQSLGLGSFTDVLLISPDARALFIPSETKNIGVEYLEN